MEQGVSPSFDSYLGGEQRLPSSMNVQEFCKSRVEEILMLTEALRESPFRGQAFQRLPKHMRRRQMSHHVKRLPRRLRNSSFLSSKDEGGSLSQKCPSRKYRRRPKNLLLEYNRRQRTSIWLETHIWHAKRFHMISKWGYKLPQRPSNKSFRACYRATTQHCYLNDMSFYSFIELKGMESRLLGGLQLCVSPKCGLTFAAKMFKNGTREGSVTLYHPNSFPYGVIGPVSFLWKPLEEGDQDRTIWIFMHPLLYAEISDMLKILFDLNQSKIIEVTSTMESSAVGVVKDRENKVEESGKKNKKADGSETNKEIIKLGRRNILLQRTLTYVDCDGSISMSILKDTINRFRLTGPLSLAIISKAFDVEIPSFSSTLSSYGSNFENVTFSAGETVNTNVLKRNYSETFGHEPVENSKRVKSGETEADFPVIISESDSVWWHRFYKKEFNRKCLKSQENFYKQLPELSSPLDLPPKMVFSLVVRDPRLTLPSKRTKCIPKADGPHVGPLDSVDPSLSCSPLWDSEIRDEVSRMKISTAEINEARSKLIVPGSDAGKLLGENKQGRVPLILIQRPGTDCAFEQNDIGSGFDIIVPAGWAMPVWLSLIYRGARTGGLRESESLILESKNLSEHFQPDSCAGEVNSMDRYNKLRTSYFRRPPSKRPNFCKIGVESPFYFPWKVLIKDWSLYSKANPSIIESENGDVKFYVLRDKGKLADLKNLLENLYKSLKSKKHSKFEPSFTEEEMDCLIQVSVESWRKGTPKEFAMLCLPTREDMQQLKSKSICPVENLHVDSNEEMRRLLRLEHSKLLKSLKRKRKKEKMKRKEEIEEGAVNRTLMKVSRKSKFSSEETVDEYNTKMENLWLQDPKNIKSVIHSCSRTIIGYITLGGFCFSKAHGLGLGYVTLRGLLLWLKTCYDGAFSPLILFRNSTSVNYRFAKLRVVAE